MSDKIPSTAALKSAQLAALSQRESDRCYSDELRIDNERIRREAKTAIEQARRDNEMPS